MDTKIRLNSRCETVYNMTTNPRNNSDVGLQQFYRHWSWTKPVRLSPKFSEMYPDSSIYRGFMSSNFDPWWKQNDFNLEILQHSFVMEREILINVIIFIAYVLNSSLNIKSCIIAHNALPLIVSGYHCLDLTNQDIWRVHCRKFICISLLENTWVIKLIYSIHSKFL